MDRKSILILVLCFVLLLLWTPLVNKLYPPKHLPGGALNNTNAPSAALTATNLAFSSNTPPPVLEAAPAPAPLWNTNVPETTLDLADANVRYTFTSHGGGIKQVELLRYPEVVDTHTGLAASNRVATLNSFTPAPILALLDGDAVQGDGMFTLTRTGDVVRAEKTLTNGLAVVKEFRLGTNYLLFASVALENRSDRPLSLPGQEWFVGTAEPMNAQDRGTAVGMMWSDGTKAQTQLGASFFASNGFACTPRVPPPEYRAGQSNVVWAAINNQYFTLIVQPQRPALAAVMRKIDLPRPSLEEAQHDKRIVSSPSGYPVALIYPAVTVEAHQSFQQQVSIYAGPKEYRTLATVAAALNSNVDAVMNFGFWGFFSKALLLGMNGLHRSLGLPYGWAIIAITIIIKVVFWPLTQASTRSAKRMQILQPQIKALQEKYKDDPVKAQRKMMEFWKEHKINPMSGCLPTLIQMPVFFGFFYMIGSAIELRGASFLWIKDLSRPDTLFLIPSVNFPFNLLPLVMGVTMLWQSHLTPPSPGMDQTQAKMMRYMPLMFLVFLYNYSAGLTLYWTVQNLLSIVQTKLIRTMPESTTAAKGPVLTAPPKKRK